MRLFVSYAHVDAVRVEELGLKLSAGGLEPWWDDHLEFGDDWKVELRNRISLCEAFICVVSADFVQSEWCQWELAQAIALEKFIVPIVVRRATVLPPAIAGLQHLDCTGGLEDRDLVRLVDRLARLKQHGTLHAQTGQGTPAGFPARFVQPLPKVYRTVAQGYLRPATPGMNLYAWPARTLAGSADRPTIGIDFGTTTCAVAFCDRGTIRLIPNDLGETTTPSAVAIGLDGIPIVGSRALDFLLRRPERGALEVKRLFGREVAKGFGGAVVLEVDGVSYRPVDLAAMVLSKVRADAGAYLGSNVRKAVLAAPAYFDHTQMATLTHAAHLAGLDVMRLLSEPVAACIGERARFGKEDTQIVVYDLGGGTFDVSIVECGEGVLEVKAVNGDTFLGGADFDRVIVDHCVAEFRETTGIDLRGNAAALMRVRDAAEHAKIDLSSTRSATIAVPFISTGPLGPLHMEVDLMRSRYNELTHDLVARTIQLTRATLEDAGCANGTAGVEVLVVGRAARAPSVRAALEDFFACRARTAPDHVVAMGAAVQAGVLDGEMKDVLLLDSTNHTLRLHVAGERTVPVVVRHTTIPTKKTVALAVPQADQENMLVRVVTGESSWPEQVLELFQLNVPCASKRGKRARIDLTFDIDANSILVVSAKDASGECLARKSIGLRRIDPQTSHEVDYADERAAGRLPSVEDEFRGGPLPEASYEDIEKVQRWLAESAVALVLRSVEAPRFPKAVKQCRQVQSWLMANPRAPLPLDILRWSPFHDFAFERELVVDLIEQRLHMDLASMRYCHSIETMAKRLVTTVRESRTRS